MAVVIVVFWSVWSDLSERNDEKTLELVWSFEQMVKIAVFGALYVTKGRSPKK